MDKLRGAERSGIGQDERLRNISQPGKRPAGKNAFSGGHAGREVLGSAKSLGVEFNSGQLRKDVGTFRRPLPGSQNHHVKYFIMLQTLGIHVVEPKRPVYFRFDRMDSASYETHPGFL